VLVLQLPPWEAVPMLEFVVLPLQTLVVVVRVGLAGADVKLTYETTESSVSRGLEPAFAGEPPSVE